MDNIERQPLLITPRLHLRPLRPDDWEALYAVASDPLIWALHPAHDRWQEPVFRGFFSQALESGGALVAIDPAHGGIIGSSRYDLTRAAPGEMEIGWTFLARRYWGGTMNAVMKRAMIGHALRFVRRVIFVVGENNLRSRRAMEKIGGVLTERIIEVPGSPQGRHVVYAIDREGFRAGPLMSVDLELAAVAE
jgi:RimJ/RimL family protein N-acetyltransferase